MWDVRIRTHRCGGVRPRADDVVDEPLPDGHAGVLYHRDGARAVHGHLGTERRGEIEIARERVVPLGPMVGDGTTRRQEPFVTDVFGGQSRVRDGLSDGPGGQRQRWKWVVEIGVCVTVADNGCSCSVRHVYVTSSRRINDWGSAPAAPWRECEVEHPVVLTAVTGPSQ